MAIWKLFWSHRTQWLTAIYDPQTKQTKSSHGLLNPTDASQHETLPITQLKIVLELEHMPQSLDFCRQQLMTAMQEWLLWMYNPTIVKRLQTCSRLLFEIDESNALCCHAWLSLLNEPLETLATMLSAENMRAISFRFYVSTMPDLPSLDAFFNPAWRKLRHVNFNTTCMLNAALIQRFAKGIERCSKSIHGVFLVLFDGHQNDWHDEHREEAKLHQRIRALNQTIPQSLCTPYTLQQQQQQKLKQILSKDDIAEVNERKQPPLTNIKQYRKEVENEWAQLIDKLLSCPKLHALTISAWLMPMLCKHTWQNILLLSICDIEHMQTLTCPNLPHVQSIRCSGVDPSGKIAPWLTAMSKRSPELHRLRLPLTCNTMTLLDEPIADVHFITTATFEIDTVKPYNIGTLGDVLEWCRESKVQHLHVTYNHQTPRRIRKMDLFRPLDFVLFRMHALQTLFIDVTLHGSWIAPLIHAAPNLHTCRFGNAILLQPDMRWWTTVCHNVRQHAQLQSFHVCFTRAEKTDNNNNTKGEIETDIGDNPAWIEELQTRQTLLKCTIEWLWPPPTRLVPRDIRDTWCIPYEQSHVQVHMKRHQRWHVVQQCIAMVNKLQHMKASVTISCNSSRTGWLHMFDSILSCIPMILLFDEYHSCIQPITLRQALSRYLCHVTRE